MQFEAQAGGRPARVLCDGGAAASFVSAVWTQRGGLQLPKLAADRPCAKVMLADGSTQKVLGCCKLTLDIQDVTVSAQCAVIKMNPDLDIILGQDWLCANKAVLDFRNNCVDFIVNDRKCVWTCTPSVHASQHFLNAAQYRRAMRNGAQSFLVHVKPVKDDEPQVDMKTGLSASFAQEVQELLHQFADRFPEDLPHLPPKRPVFHTIPLQDPNGQPPFRGMYRLSLSEKAEVERHIAELLRKGFIEPSSSPYGAHPIRS
jgi:hypothetical protein